MADDSPLLGTVFVGLDADPTKLTAALNLAEKHAQKSGAVIENSLGTSFAAATNAAKKLESQVVAGSPRIQYSYYQAAASLKNLEDQIKKTTTAGGTLTGDQVKQYATLKSKIDDLTPAVESQRRTMIAARAELQAGIGVWGGWEAAAARALSDFGYAGAGQKFLVAGGVIGAVAASVVATKTILGIVSPESLQWYTRAWNGVMKAIQDTNREETDFLILAARVASGEGADAYKGLGGGLLDPIQRANNQPPGAKLYDDKTNAEMEKYNDIEKAALEYEKERADILGNTAASDKAAMALKDLELREEGYTDALMKDGDALRHLMVARDEELRQLERSQKAKDDAEKKREESFNKSASALFAHQNKNDFFDITPIPKTFTEDEYLSYLKQLSAAQLAVAKASDDARDAMRLEAREVATTAAGADIDKYGAAYRANLMDKSRGITRDEFIDLVTKRRQLLDSKLRDIDTKYSDSVTVMLGNIAHSYGSTYDQIESLTKSLVTDIESGWQNVFFDGITGNLAKLKSDFHATLDALLKDVINFMVRREVQQLLNLAVNWYASNYGLPLSNKYSGYNIGPGHAMGGVLSGGFVPIGAFASGGIVTRPTLGLVGEGNYNEAVVPLPDGKSIPVQMAGGGGDRRIQVEVSMEDGLIARIVNGSVQVSRKQTYDDLSYNGALAKRLRVNA